MLLPIELALKCPRRVIDNVDGAAGDVIVRQLHNVIKIIAGSADMQNVDKAVMRPRDRFKCGHTLKLTLK